MTIRELLAFRAERQRAWQRKSNQNRRARLMAAGLCQHCGQRPPSRKKGARRAMPTLCLPCLEDRRIAYRVAARSEREGLRCA